MTQESLDKQKVLRAGYFIDKKGKPQFSYALLASQMAKRSLEEKREPQQPEYNFAYYIIQNLHEEGYIKFPKEAYREKSYLEIKREERAKDNPQPTEMIE